MNPFNPNAAPFRPGMRYQQQQAHQTQSTYSSTAAPTNSPYGQKDGGSARPNKSFRFDPFGYGTNEDRNAASNNYNQQPHRQSFSPQANVPYYGGGANLVHQQPSSYRASTGYAQQQNPQLVTNHPPPASCSTYYSSTYNTQPAQQPYLQDQRVDRFAAQTAYTGQMEGMGYENGANVVNGGPEGDFGLAEGAPPQYTLSADLMTKMQANPNCSSLFEIQIGLEQLIYESQEFDTWASAIRDRLTSQDFTRDDLLLACSIIVEMGVLIADCQYNFSRLCQFLNQNIPYFGTEFLIPVLEEFTYSNSSFMDVEQAKNLLQFLAELYDKIEVNKAKSMQLSTLLGEQINQLLKHKCNPSNESITALIKTVVQALKLVGRFLENDQGPAVVNDIFEMLNGFCNRSANQWGVTNIEQSSSSNPTSSSNLMIIGPDGNPLSEEECAFLDDNYDAYDNSPAGSWNGVGALEEDEVLEDYEKFLQATAIRAAEKALEKISFDDDDDDENFGSYQQQQQAHQTQSTYSSTAAPTNSPYGQKDGGSARANKPFPYDPFGYGTKEDPKLPSVPSSTEQKTPSKESETKQ